MYVVLSDVFLLFGESSQTSYLKKNEPPLGVTCEAMLKLHEMKRNRKNYYRTYKKMLIMSRIKILQCQEQIELSGLLANELSAFLFLDESSLGTGAERRTNAGLTHAEELSIAIFRAFCGAWRKMAVGNSVKQPLIHSSTFPVNRNRPVSGGRGRWPGIHRDTDGPAL